MSKVRKINQEEHCIDDKGYSVFVYNRKTKKPVDIFTANDYASKRLMLEAVNKYYPNQLKSVKQ